MSRREEPGDHCAPVVAGHVRGVAAESLDEAGHIIDQVVDRVALDSLGSIGEPITAKVRRHREASCFGQRRQLPRPRLRAFGESVQEDEHVALRRTIDQRSESKAVRSHHVLARGHLASPPCGEVASDPQGRRPVGRITYRCD